MKQSSVDYMLSWIESNCLFHFEDKKKLREVCERAKAMHKQEYIDAWMNGQNDSGYSQKELKQMAEADYNETFGE